MLNPTVTTPPEFDHAGTFVILSHFDTRCGHITTRDTLCFQLSAQNELQLVYS